jgi:hypothetical protein
MRIRESFYKLTAAIIMMTVLNLSKAQSGNDTKKGAELYDEIMRLDSILFTAFNKRDTMLFKEFFTKDLEFYHDKGGLTGFEHTINFMRTTAQAKSDLRRDLVEGSSEVYAVPGYGAMQIGKHRFCHTENSRNDCGTFKFVHIWQYKEGKWKISRVVSYDH